MNAKIARRVARLGLATLLCSQVLPLAAQSGFPAERNVAERTLPGQAPQPPQEGRWVRLVKTTSLNAIAKSLFPDDRATRDRYRANLAGANTKLFPNTDNASSVMLSAGTALFVPTGTPLPTSDLAIPGDGQTAEDRGQLRQAGNPALGPVALAASQRKIKACLPRIDQASKALSEGAKSGAFLFNSLDDPDKKILSISMEIGDGANASYASATFAPVGSRGCSVSADVVTWWPANCAEVMTKAFPQVTVSGALMRDIRITEAGATMRVFFMPAGTGCVTIKKEVLF